jgi:hypothetical protein
VAVRMPNASAKCGCAGGARGSIEVWSARASSSSWVFRATSASSTSNRSRSTSARARARSLSTMLEVVWSEFMNVVMTSPNRNEKTTIDG